MARDDEIGLHALLSPVEVQHLLAIGRDPREFTTLELGFDQGFDLQRAPNGAVVGSLRFAIPPNVLEAFRAGGLFLPDGRPTRKLELPFPAVLRVCLAQSELTSAYREGVLAALRQAVAQQRQPPVEVDASEDSDA
jgi:hypothetical protein